MVPAPSPVRVQNTVLPYLAYAPSVMTLIVAGAAIACIIVYVTQLLRAPKGTFWTRNLRFSPFVNPRLGVGSMVAMIVLVGLTIAGAAHDRTAHAAAVEAQRAQEAAIQTQVKDALGTYYGVSFPDEYDRIWSSTRNPYDHLPGDPIALRMADGTARADCYVGDTAGFYVLSCGPKDSAAPLDPVSAAPAS